MESHLDTLLHELGPTEIREVTEGRDIRFDDTDACLNGTHYISYTNTVITEGRPHFT